MQTESTRLRTLRTAQVARENAFGLETVSYSSRDEAGNSSDEAISDEEVPVTVKKSPAASKSKTPVAPTASQAWQNVLARMSDLGDAMGQWTKVAASEADIKQKFEHVRAGINDIAQEAATALGHAESESGQQVKEGIEQAAQAFGDAAQRVREATEPHVKDAFADLSDVFGKAAARRGEPSSAPPKDSSTPAEPKASNKSK